LGSLFIASVPESVATFGSVLNTILCRPFRAVAHKKLTQAEAWAIVLLALRAANMPKPQDFVFIMRR
jgi:hypothetical protein